jgi:hypothetical protein
MSNLSLLIALAACSSPDLATTETATTGIYATASVWEEVTKGADSALLSLWSDDKITAVVGGNDGLGAQFYTYSESDWLRHSITGDGDLWWVWGTEANLYAVGEHGRVATIERATSTASVTTLDASVHLFGIWGSADTDIWAVGGAPYKTEGAALWHFDGSDWSEWTNVPVSFDELNYAFKVWGSAADDVWVVGISGYSMHFDGTDWTHVQTPISDTVRTLFTVSGDDEGNVYAVGGAGDGNILRWNGTDWIDETPDFTPQLNGVSVVSGYPPVACGKGGVCYERTDGVWTRDGRGPASDFDVHATLRQADGGVWTVGGYMGSYPLSDGFISYDGPTPPTTLNP